MCTEDRRAFTVGLAITDEGHQSEPLFTGSERWFENWAFLKRRSGSMMGAMLDLRHLQLFVTAAEHLHFREVAAVSNVSVGALSQAMGRIEATLGTDLFDRTAQNVRLTPSGAVFLVEAKRLLHQTERSVARMQHVRAEAQTRLRIGYYPSLAVPAVEQPVLDLVRAQEGVTLTLDDGSPAELAQRLTDDELDLIVTSPSSARGKFEAVELARVPLCVVVHQDHEFAARPSVELSDVSGEVLVLLSRLTDPEWFDSFVGACHQIGFVPRPSQIVSRAELVLPSVGLGLGVGIVPATVAEIWQSPRVRARPIADGPTTAVVAYVRKQQETNRQDDAISRLFAGLKLVGSES